MSDVAAHRPPSLGPAIAPDGTIAAWVRHAMDRAAEAGIDPLRVGLALAIPMSALEQLDAPAAPGPPAR